MKHDIIAIGASAGGVDLLLNMVRELPATLHASVFVVIHSSPSAISPLPGLLSHRGRLPASHPLHGDRIEIGHIYIAPPDSQLLVRSGFMDIVRGPKENGHRPSVDALFRSAALAYGPRVVGIVLSGHQDCGTAGMLSIKARGGVCIVQDPDTAAVPEMPRSALEKVPADFVVHPLELPGLLTRLSGAEAGEERDPEPYVKQLEGTDLGPRAELVCPICQGVLTEAQPGVFQHFRCHVGHTFSLEALVREQSEEMERALWAGVRALEEGAALSHRLEASAKGELKERFAEKTRTQTANADVIRQILLHGAMLTRPDSKKLEQ